MDDLRFYLRPINRGWTWQDGGCSFRDNDHDDRDMYNRTVEEISKSLSSIWKFVQFATEGQKDYWVLTYPGFCDKGGELGIY